MYIGVIPKKPANMGQIFCILSLLIHERPQLKLTKEDADSFVPAFLKKNANDIQDLLVVRRTPTMGDLKNPDAWNDKFANKKTIIKKSGWSSQSIFKDYDTLLYYIRYDGKREITKHGIGNRK